MVNNARPSATEPRPPARPTPAMLDAAALIAEVGLLRAQMDTRVMYEREAKTKLDEQQQAIAKLRSKVVQLEMRQTWLDSRARDDRRSTITGLVIGLVAFSLAVALTFGWL